ncbi:hypothetical protein AK830_g11516 [Neonectria ditissima]|uniref:Uncharacterized protein n=1 Tax=Neonectria ditissima TaxID=78410 RepID=A0A0N8H533_9HYPO|nr:hypothetical protein AK830_g11516 [Neonectria ditissima]
MASAPFIQRLPNELLVHVLGFLDSPSHMQHDLQRDPTSISRPVDTGITTGVDTPIKNASLVCRLWRQSALRLLFRHAVWSFQRFYKPTDPDIVSKIPILDFLKRNGLSQNVESFTILIDPPKGTGNFRYADGEFWGLLPPEDRPPRPPMSWNLLWSVISAGAHQTLAQQPASANEANAREAEEAARPHWDNNWLWCTIFGQLDPLRITLISSADIISSLLSRSVDLTNEWAFNSQYHIVSLSRASRSFLDGEGASASTSTCSLLPSERQGTIGGPTPSDLFSIRDWTSLLVNEGSFVPVYSTYEFFHYSAPTLLPVILNSSDSSFNHLRRTLHTFSYIGIFPLSRHIQNVVLRYCPPVEHFYLQIMPSDPNFWQSNDLAHVDITDLWLESDTAYSLVMPDVFDRNVKSRWEKLQVFESGDTSMEEAWMMAMQHAQVHGLNGWKMPKEGYFVRGGGNKALGEPVQIS